jgi:hypothetical protein
MPRMHSIMQPWIAARRYELLDRTLIWKQAHLLHAWASTNGTTTVTSPSGCRERPAATSAAARITDPATITHLHIHRHDRLGGLLHEYNTPPELYG